LFGTGRLCFILSRRRKDIGVLQREQILKKELSVFFLRSGDTLRRLGGFLRRFG
jgi:hypothetical protein